MADLTTREAATRLGVTPSRVRQMLLAGHLRGTHHGRDWLIPEDAIDTITRPKRGRPKREDTMSERLTPSAAWDQFVGEQTPEEFATEAAAKHPAGSPLYWVTDYVESVPGIFGQGQSAEDYWREVGTNPDELADLLTEYLTANLPAPVAD